MENARRLGGLLLIDKVGGGEAGAVFVAYLMRLGLCYRDAMTYVKGGGGGGLAGPCGCFVCSCSRIWKSLRHTGFLYADTWHDASSKLGPTLDFRANCMCTRPCVTTLDIKSVIAAVVLAVVVCSPG